MLRSCLISHFLIHETIMRPFESKLQPKNSLVINDLEVDALSVLLAH